MDSSTAELSASAASIKAITPKWSAWPGFAPPASRRVTTPCEPAMTANSSAVRPNSSSASTPATLANASTDGSSPWSTAQISSSRASRAFPFAAREGANGNECAATSAVATGCPSRAARASHFAASLRSSGDPRASSPESAKAASACDFAAAADSQRLASSSDTGVPTPFACTRPRRYSDCASPRSAPACSSPMAVANCFVRSATFAFAADSLSVPGPAGATAFAALRAWNGRWNASASQNGALARMIPAASSLFVVFLMRCRTSSAR